jgi:hypothetical protein
VSARVRRTSHNKSSRCEVPVYFWGAECNVVEARGNSKTSRVRPSSFDRLRMHLDLRSTRTKVRNIRVQILNRKSKIVNQKTATLSLFSPTSSNRDMPTKLARCEMQPQLVFSMTSSIFPSGGLQSISVTRQS